MRFRTTVDLNGGTATGMRVLPEIVEALRSGKRRIARSIDALREGRIR